MYTEALSIAVSTNGLDFLETILQKFVYGIQQYVGHIAVFHDIVIYTLDDDILKFVYFSY